MEPTSEEEKIDIRPAILLYYAYLPLSSSSSPSSSSCSSLFSSSSCSSNPPSSSTTTFTIAENSNQPPMSLSPSHQWKEERGRKGRKEGEEEDKREILACCYFEAPGVPCLRPSIRQFSDLPAWLEEEEGREGGREDGHGSSSAFSSLKKKDTKILMYCTGGVRCERASAFLQARGYRKVVQLQGGIQRYLEAFPDGGFFQGKNFVFDERVTGHGRCHAFNHIMHVLSYAALALAACASQTLAFVPAGPLSGMASSSKSRLHATKMTIDVGSKLPLTTTFQHLADGKPTDVPALELFAGKKIVLVGVPGALTPTCSVGKEADGEGRREGKEDEECLIQRFPLVWLPWHLPRRIHPYISPDAVKFYADGGASFTKAAGLEFDTGDFGGLRMQRMSALVEDGVVKKIHLEGGGGLSSSAADVLLGEL
ncbi:rhodanese-like domain-containing protein 6-like [Nannochloropsis oceanica]